MAVLDYKNAVDSRLGADGATGNKYRRLSARLQDSYSCKLSWLQRAITVFDFRFNRQSSRSGCHVWRDAGDASAEIPVRPRTRSDGHGLADGNRRDCLLRNVDAHT